MFSEGVDSLVNRAWFMQERLALMLLQVSKHCPGGMVASLAIEDKIRGVSLILARSATGPALLSSKVKAGEEPSAKAFKCSSKTPFQVIGSNVSFSFPVKDAFNLVFAVQVNIKNFSPEILKILSTQASLMVELSRHEELLSPDPAMLVQYYLQLIRLNSAESSGHLHRVARYSLWMARHFAASHGLSDDWIDAVHAYSPLHDIGKIFVPGEILKKTKRLSVSDCKQIRRHSIRGSLLVEDLIHMPGHQDELHRLDVLRNIVAAHHETLDGRGYPLGLSGSAIPLEARIVAVADILDALLSERPYKKAWSLSATLGELKNLRGRKLDPDIVDFVLARSSYIRLVMQDKSDQMSCDLSTDDSKIFAASAADYR